MLVLSSVDLPNEEQVKQREPNTLAYLRDTNLGEGTLYISKDRFVWCADNGQGFTLAYPQISLHAISRDLNNFHSECLYLMIENDDNNSESETTDEESELNELRIVPRDLSKLDSMYRALCECQLLHPDPQDSVSEDEDEEVEANDAGGDYHNNHDMETEDGQFDDAIN